MKGLNIRYVLILIFSLFLAVGSIYAETKMIPLYIGEETFTVEIADNPVTQARGLMFRKSVPDNFGMLFVYDVANYYGFWMKNCFVHLDLIFLNKDKQVVEIFFNVPPCEQEPCKSYAPSIPAQYILELRGNRSKEIGLKEGDSISFILE